ncbi:hypothetical protein SETIT_3G034200v2 [Setaria italica]|uniref:F-box domain-containing protein n=1 Tax=Setaria italica TaxID=4555 RepID=A0A368QBD9_SETIT|nr:hypothetical protein SETIT_3G034200v2 [Setaria italica]
MEEEAPPAPTADINQDAPVLPPEVITEIFARLPAKSVGRFRCLSRAWCAMLSTDYFVDLHLRCANRPDHPRLLLTAVGSDYDDHLHSWRPGGAVEKLMPDDFADAITTPVTKPCRGLILIGDAGYGGYFVCNPSTGDVLALPDSEAPKKMTWRVNKLFQPQPPPLFVDVSYGIGYCTMRKEFKLVRFFCNSETENGLAESTNCEVFVLDRAAYWRPTTEQPPLRWVEKRSQLISDETFGSLPPPSGFEDAASVMTELDGCLSLGYGEPDSGDLYHVFVLRDYKEARWEMLCCVNRSLWMAPLGMYYSDGAQKIMFGTGACKVFAVDVDGTAPQVLFTPDDTIIGSCEDDHIPALGLYEESLVPAGRTIEEIICSSPTAEAWFDILKWLPVRSVLELSLPVRVSCAFWGFICNPAIGYCEHIEFDNSNDTFFAGRIGLGYDSEIDKHLLVHITYKEDNLETRYYELQCKMRYVNHEQWRPLDPPPRPVAAMPPTFVNGNIYWMVEPNLGPVSATCEIVAFDIQTQEFEVLQGPPCSHDSGHMTILQLQGALYRGVWLMKYHIELEKFLPDYLLENTTPLVVDPKDGRILLNAGWSLGYYDPKTAEIETIYTQDVPEHGWKFCPIICHESLVWPFGPS